MGAREEHSHVARASTWLFLSRSRLDRNHSCTHSTLVLALVETFAWWTLACFWRWRVNALDSAEENGCARTAVGCSSSWVGCASEHPLVGPDGTILATCPITCPSGYHIAACACACACACPSVTTTGYHILAKETSCNLHAKKHSGTVHLNRPYHTTPHRTHDHTTPCTTRS